MKSCIFVLFVVICLLSIFQSVKGLQCYKCAHVTGVPHDKLPQNKGYRFDESCKHGSTPTSKFLYSCETEYPGEDTVCAKLKISTYMPFFKTPIEIIGRNCLPAKLVKKGCNKVAREDLSWLPGMASGVIRMLPQNPTMVMCTCKNDKCNGGNAGVSAGRNSFPWRNRYTG